MLDNVGRGWSGVAALLGKQVDESGYFFLLAARDAFVCGPPLGDALLGDTRESTPGGSLSNDPAMAMPTISSRFLL